MRSWHFRRRSRAVGQRFDKFDKQHKDGKPKDAKKGGKPAPAQGNGQKKGKKPNDKPNPNKFPDELKIPW